MEARFIGHYLGRDDKGKAEGGIKGESEISGLVPTSLGLDLQSSHFYK